MTFLVYCIYIHTLIDEYLDNFLVIGAIVLAKVPHWKTISNYTSIQNGKGKNLKCLLARATLISGVLSYAPLRLMSASYFSMIILNISKWPVPWFDIDQICYHVSRSFLHFVSTQNICTTCMSHNSFSPFWAAKCSAESPLSFVAFIDANSTLLS